MSSTTGTSTSQVLSSVVLNVSVLGGFTLGFLLLRLKFKRIYQPKSLDLIIKVNKNQEYLEPLPTGFLSWLPPLLRKPAPYIILQAGLDGYFFLRYIGVIMLVSVGSLVVIFPVLFPLNATDSGGQTGLDRLSYSNIRDRNRTYAHAILALFYYPIVLFVLYRELIYYTNLRQAVLSSPKYAFKQSSRTVLLQSVPEQYLHESELRKLFDGVKRVWLATANKDLGSKVDTRKKLARNLEGTLTKMLKQAVKVKKNADEKGRVIEPADELVAYVPQNKRPTTRRSKIPFWGPKIDKLDYIKEELAKVNQEISEMNLDTKNKSTMNSVFVEFENQYQAQVAYNLVVHHRPLTLSEHYIGVEPEDVIWINMRMFWYERLVRQTAAVAAIVATVIFWTFPVAVVGAISNINYLMEKVHFLRFLGHLPDKLMGIVTAVLPSLLLAALMALLPIFIRLMAKIAGCPTKQHVEYFTQQAYFAFQVVQVFLITTITSSASSVVAQIINKPTSAMSLLSQNLPKASNFYVSYIALQSFSISGGVLLQITTLALFYVFGFIFDSTARKKWDRYTNLPTTEWGTYFPPYTNLAVIIMAYSIISPIVLLFTAVGFGILYVAFLYYLCYVNSNVNDSRGVHYPRALFQTIVGIYIGQICLLGLFVVRKSWGPIVIIAIGLGITVFVHVNMNYAFDNLLNTLPVDTMKPLDGKSETPSYFQQASRRSSRISESTQFDVSRAENDDFKEARVQIGDETKASDIQILGEYYDSLSGQPLLAEYRKTAAADANFLVRFFQPSKYLSFEYCKQLIPDLYRHIDANDVEPDPLAYAYPALHEKPPVVWIPRDPMGLSRHEIANFQGVIEISDQGSQFNSKGKVVFMSPPPDFEGRVFVGNDIEMDDLN